MGATDETPAPVATPVAIPRPDLTPLVTGDDWEEGDAAITDVVAEPVDWRPTAATFLVVWAGFTSLVVFIAPTSAGSLGAWFLATAAMGAETNRQRRAFRRWQRWVRHCNEAAMNVIER